MNLEEQVTDAERTYEQLNEELTLVQARIAMLQKELNELDARKTLLAGAAFSNGGLVKDAERQLNYLRKLHRDSRLLQFSIQYADQQRTLVILTTSNKFLYCREVAKEKELRLNLQTGVLESWNLNLSPDEMASVRKLVTEHRRQRLPKNKNCDPDQ